MARLLATSPPLLTSPATWTAVSTLPPTIEVVAVPIGASPARATVTQAPDDVSSGTALPSTAIPQLGLATLTPTLTPTRFQPTVAVRSDLVLTIIDPPVLEPTGLEPIGATAYEYDVGPEQLFPYAGLQVGGGLVLFAPNPVSPESFLRTDQLGLLHYRALGATAETQMAYSPFHLGFGAPSSDLNKNRVVEIDWSADGQQFSFRVDPPLGQDNASAGVWFWQPELSTPTDPTYPIIRDCVAEGYIPCLLVHRIGPWHWKTTNVEWSPVQGDNSVLLMVDLPDENRGALAMVQALRDSHYANVAPAFLRYDYGYWNPNGNGIVVSGRRPDGRVIIGEVNNDLGGERLLFDASAAGLWLQNAVRRPNGQIVALGRPGGPRDNLPLSLYDQYGRVISGQIGNAAPDDVQWYPDRSAVVLKIADRQYTAHIDSGIIIDTSDLTRNPSFGGGLIGSLPLPSGVVRGSEFAPGEQLRALQNLNLREGPSTSHQIIGGLSTGDYIAIIAGPHDAGGYRWWRVQTADNILGWVAGVIGGRPSIARG